MAAVAPTIRVEFRAGYLITTWSATDQRSYKLSVTRTPYFSGKPPEYGTERQRGDFEDTGSAHLIHNSSHRGLVWGRSSGTSGRVCTGTYVVRMYYINTRNERSITVQSDPISVTGIACPEPETDRDDPAPGELPAPTITAPTEGQVIAGENVRAAWTVPTGQPGVHQSDFIIAIYHPDDVRADDEPLRAATYGTIQNVAQAENWQSAIWVPGNAREITFTDQGASRETNDKVCNSPAGRSWVMRLRYRNAQGTRSAAAVRKFMVTGVPCPAPRSHPRRAR